MNNLIYAEHIVGLINLFVICFFGLLLLFRDIDFPNFVCLGLEFWADLALSYSLMGGLSIAIMR